MTVRNGKAVVAVTVTARSEPCLWFKGSPDGVGKRCRRSVGAQTRMFVVQLESPQKSLG